MNSTDYKIKGLETSIHYSSRKNPAIILLHGAMGHKDAVYRVKFAEELNYHGYNVIRFNFSVASKGKEVTDNFFTKQVKDLENIILHCKENYSFENLAIMGACSGANLALLAGKDKQIKSIVALAPFEIPKDLVVESNTLNIHDYNDVDKTHEEYFNDVNKVLSDEKRLRMIRKIGIPISKEAILDFKSLNINVEVQKIPEKTPVLFIIGNKDPVINLEMVKPIYAQKRGVKELQIIPARSHGYINPKEAELVDNLAYSWFNKTIPII